MQRISSLPALLLGFALLGLSAARGNPASSPAPAAPPATNAAAASDGVPLSVFVIPKSPEQGRDPFFPHSTRMASSSTPKNTQPKVVPIDLHLNGISGLASSRFAIVNGQTFAVGEEHDLTAGTQRVHVRCVEISADSATVEVNSERRQLHLRSGLR
jgi:hypothetical protein